jgi:sulfopyruvate decarboxylase TPP-binding subunit
MIKVMDFWKLLCEGLGYRFFTGVPCKGLNTLYNKMSSSFLHYVPAANEQIAVNIANGAFLTNTKVIVFMDASYVKKLDLSFNLQNEIPLFIVASGKGEPKIDGDIHRLTLAEIDEDVIIGNKVRLLFIEEGFLQ